MPHAIQIRQTGGPEVLNWTPIEVGAPESGQVRLIEADRLVSLLEAISFDQAATMMLRRMTAQMLIRQVYPVKAGDLILVHAAAGGPGHIVCQWAAALGATVIGTVSTEAKAEMAHAHGCKHTILYTKQDFVFLFVELRLQPRILPTPAARLFRLSDGGFLSVPRTVS